MFAYPLASPLQQLGTGDLEYQIAFLQAEIPDRSETSRYRIAVMDRDGSNRRTLFPEDESPGLEPQQSLGRLVHRAAARRRHWPWQWCIKAICGW